MEHNRAECPKLGHSPPSPRGHWGLSIAAPDKVGFGPPVGLKWGELGTVRSTGESATSWTSSWPGWSSGHRRLPEPPAHACFAMLAVSSQGLPSAVCQPPWSTGTIIILEHISDPGLLCPPPSVAGSLVPGSEPWAAQLPAAHQAPLASLCASQLAGCASLPAFLRRCRAWGCTNAQI